MSRRTSFTRVWKTAGALVSPKGMTQYSKCLRGVLKAVFHSSPSLIRTRWYAFLRSNLVKMVASRSELNAESMRGRGYLFRTVMLFKPLKSIQWQRVLSFFSTKKKPAPTGEEEGRISPAARESVI